MKITDSTQHGQVPAPGSGSTSEGRGVKGEFREIMERIAPRESGQVQEGAGPEGPPPPGGVQIVPGLTQVGPSARKAEVLSQLKETIDTIDFYAARLGDPRVSTRDMAPLVSHLETRMTELDKAAHDQELPEGLRSMLSDLAAAIGSEVAKFGRGDYD
jgi:hypothetical protein